LAVERLEKKLFLILEAKILQREWVFDDPAASTLKGLLFHLEIRPHTKRHRTGRAVSGTGLGQRPLT
jgi:hypothetical protein